MDRLYGVPLEDFTKERNALVKKLRDAGEAEAADSLRALRKPTLPAWALNQVARRHQDLVRDLLDVQEDLAGTASGSALRHLATSRRDLINRLVREAEAVLEASGHAAGSETVQKISRTLLATGDEEAADLLRGGRLERELVASGFDQVFGVLPEDSPEDEGAREQEELARAVQELESQAAAAEERAAALAAEGDDLRRRTEEVTEAAASAGTEAEKLRKQAEDAARGLG